MARVRRGGPGRDLPHALSAVSTSQLLGWSAFFVVVVTGFFLIDQRHVWGEPTEQAVVVDVEETSRRSGGKGDCALAVVTARVRHPRPDLPEPVTRFTDCVEHQAVGDEMPLRRVPGHPDRTFPDPVPAAGLPRAVGEITLATGALLGVAALLQAGGAALVGRLRAGRRS